MSATRPPDTDPSTLSPECAVAREHGPEELHGQCRQTEDIPLPHSTGIVLVARCRCGCHPWARRRKVRKP